MDGSGLRLGAGQLGSPSKNHGSLGRRSLGAPPRWLGLDCRPLAVKQQDSADWRLSEDTNLTAPSASGIATFRRRLLWIHGTILTLVALGSAALTTIGWMIGIGPFGFMHQNPMVWVGLIQAYLLMTFDPWGRSGEYQKVACRWSTGARCSFDSSLLFIGCIRINGSARNCLDTDYVSYCLSQS
jgi:hypothetical protein